MLRRLLMASTIFFGFSLSGCGLSPQQLSPQAEIKTPIVVVGQGQPVLVRVVDSRPSPIIGTRGGLYPETSTISVPSANIVPRLQSQAETGVRLLGFTPSAGAVNAPQLTITLSELKYVTPKDSIYVREADISAIFDADVQNGNRRYNGRYAASLNQHFGMAPNEEANNQLVSGVLSDALNRLFRDPAIGQALLP